MLISHNEIEATCKKVFEGMGFAAGEDEAAAVSVAWLELHGLPILATFGEHLGGMGQEVGCMPTLVEETPTSVSFDCDSCCCLITGTPAVSYAFAKAMQVEQMLCELHGVGLPELLLPQLVSFAQRGLSIAMTWEDQTAVVNEGEQYPMLTRREGKGKTADSKGALPHTIITFQKIPFTNPTHPLKKPTDFHAAYKHHCHHGIVVDENVWQTYIKLSKAVLVPETEASRLRGAGEDAA